MKKIILILMLLIVGLMIIGIWYSNSMRDFDGLEHEVEKLFVLLKTKCSVQ